MMETVIAALGANALVLAALSFLLRSLIGHRFEKDMAEFKRDIELTAHREIEAYKAQLEKERLRLQISYGGIFAKQAQTILDVYKILVALEKAAFDAVYPGESKPEKRQAEFRQSWSAIRTSYDENRILLPQDIDEMLQDFMKKMFSSVFEYTRLEIRTLRNVPEEEYHRLFDKQDAALKIIESDLPALRERLILNMRRTMGVGGSEN
jgi:hypothetical protein